MKKIISILSCILIVLITSACKPQASTIYLKNLGINQEYVQKYHNEDDYNVLRIYEYEVGEDINSLEINFIKLKDNEIESHPFNINLDSNKGIIMVMADELISNKARVKVVGNHQQMLEYNYNTKEEELQTNLSYGSLIKEIKLNKDQRIHIFYQGSSNNEDGAIAYSDYFDKTNNLEELLELNPYDQETYLITVMFGE